MQSSKKTENACSKKLQAFSVCEKMVKSICYEDKGVIKIR